MSDVTYYKYMKYVDVENLYNVDSQEDFIRFATDHYGESWAFTSEYLS